jgi:hypothetical protein
MLIAPYGRTSLLPHNTTFPQDSENPILKRLLKKVSAIEHYILLAEFQNGEKRYYDVSPWIRKNKAFKPLESVKGLFANVNRCQRNCCCLE